MGSYRNSFLTFLGYLQLRVSRSIIDLNQKINQVQTRSFIHFLQYKFEYIRQFVSWPKSWFFFCSCFLVQIKVEKWNKELVTMGWNQFSEGEVLFLCSKVQQTKIAVTKIQLSLQSRKSMRRYAQSYISAASK